MRFRRQPFWLTFTCLLLSLVPGVGAAQTAGPARELAIEGPPPPVPPQTVSRGEDGRMTIRAVRVDRPIVLDGALTEDIYRSVPPITNFIQQFPRNGQPATEDTEVWIFFDDKNVYVTLRCADSHPDEMVANELRRDHTNIWQNDNVVVFLDTFYDRRSAFFFQTNPIGGVREALVIDEATTNFDWNTVWDVRNQRSETGWTSEMAIPFKSLRYNPGAAQVWGFQVLRVARATNEFTLLSPVPPTFGGTTVARFGATLVGIDPPSDSRVLELKPYAISNVTTNRPAGVSNDLDGAFGLDAKYGLTSSMAVDLTYNTDFAQVEIDEQQVNLTRFNLFIPEKRDFFLEGQGIFEFAGSGARRVNVPDETPILFFSRRIGLSGGGPVTIRGGGRLMGRVGRLSLGVLNIQTEEEPRLRALATNFSVVRVKRDILRRSNVGFIVTNRNPMLPGSGSNQVYGVDANLSFFENVRVNSYYARSATTGVSGDAESYRGQLLYGADRYGLELQRLKVGNAFSPEVGFLRRQDFDRTFVVGRFSPRPRNLRGVRKLTWEGQYDRYVGGSSGTLETQIQTADFKVELENSDLLTVDYIRNYEFFAAPFTLAGGLTVPVGGHRFQELSASYLMGPQRDLNGTVNIRTGGFFTGKRTQLGYTGRLIFNPRLAVEPRISIDWVDLPQGDARITLLGARPVYTITPRMFVSALVQYNSASRTLETNARWRWEYEPGSDLFVVYTDGRETGRRGFPELLNRGIAIKFTRFFRF